MKSLASHIHLAKRLMTVLDTKFSFFGIKFGIDPLMDVIPWFGSFFGAALSCYLFWIAYRLKVSKGVHVRMLGNIVIDYLLGLIPFAGIVVDLFYRSNAKNFALLEKHFDPDILEGEFIEE